MSQEVQLKIDSGKIVVSSRVVAENFGKQHGHVLRDIEKLMGNMGGEFDTPKLECEFFIESAYPLRGKLYKEYLLTRDGFSLLVMGFTGKEALQWKLKYIEAFNMMETKLKSQVPQLTEKQQLQLAILNGGEFERLEALKQYEALVTQPLLDTIEEQKPCVEYVDAVSAQQDSVLVREVCKMAYTEQKIEIGEKKLYNVLRYWKLVCLRNTEPTQMALNKGYLEVDCKIINTPYGERETYTTVVKPKGQIYIIQRLAKMSPEEINGINKIMNEKRK